MTSQTQTLITNLTNELDDLKKRFQSLGNELTRIKQNAILPE
jgi:hypothetical protein